MASPGRWQTRGSPAGDDSATLYADSPDDSRCGWNYGIPPANRRTAACTQTTPRKPNQTASDTAAIAATAACLQAGAAPADSAATNDHSTQRHGSYANLNLRRRNTTRYAPLTRRGTDDSALRLAGAQTRDCGSQAANGRDRTQ